MATQKTAPHHSPSPSPSPPPYSPSPLPKGRLIILNSYPSTSKQAVLLAIYNKLIPIYTQHHPYHPWPIRILDTATLIDAPLLKHCHGTKTLEYYSLRWKARKHFFRDVCEKAVLMGQTILLAEELADTDSDLADFLQLVETKRRVAPGLEMHWLTWNYQRGVLEEEIVAMEAKRQWAEKKGKGREGVEERRLRRREGVRRRLEEVKRHPGLLRTSLHVAMGAARWTGSVMNWKGETPLDVAVTQIMRNLGAEMSAITRANLRIPDGVKISAVTRTHSRLMDAGVAVEIPIRQR